MKKTGKSVILLKPLALLLVFLFMSVSVFSLDHFEAEETDPDIVQNRDNNTVSFTPRVQQLLLMGSLKGADAPDDLWPEGGFGLWLWQDDNHPDGAIMTNDDGSDDYQDETLYVTKTTPDKTAVFGDIVFSYVEAYDNEDSTKLNYKDGVTYVFAVQRLVPGGSTEISDGVFVKDGITTQGGELLWLEIVIGLDDDGKVMVKSHKYYSGTQGDHYGIGKAASIYGASLNLKKDVTADTNAPINGNIEYTNGTFAFTVSGPADLTKTVTITMSGGKMTGAALDGTALGDDESAGAVFDEEDGVTILGLGNGTYTVSEGDWTPDQSVSRPDGIAMYLKEMKVNGETVTDATAIQNKTVEVTFSDTVRENSAAYTNKLVPVIPHLEKQVTNLCDSIDNPAADFVSEHPWNKSADYDIGDDVPYRVTTFIPSEYYRRQESYYYRIDDEMNHLQYKAGSGRVYAFVKSDTDETGIWYDISTFFTIDAGTYADGRQTIQVHPSNDNYDLKAVISGRRVTNWGADTHGDAYPYKVPELADATAIVNGDIRYLQFRYRATLKEDANIGPQIGNTNTAILNFGDSSDPQATESDTNVVYTYRLFLSKRDEIDDTISGAEFQLFKKYVMDKTGYGEAKTFDGQLFFYGLSDDVTDLDTSKIIRNSMFRGNFYLVTETSDATVPEEFEWNGIDDGYYILVETKAPDEYTPLGAPIVLQISTTLYDDEPGFRDGYVNIYPDELSYFSYFDRTLFEGSGQIIAAIPNYKTGELTIEKVISEADEAAAADLTFTFKVRFVKDGEPYTGLVRITDKDREEIVERSRNGEVTVKITGSGTAVIADIPTGVTYTVTETNVPDGWSPETSGSNGRISAGNDAKTTVTNIQTSVHAVSIMKKAADTGEPLGNAGFVIMYGDRFVQPDGSIAENEYVFVTDEEGSFTVENVRQGAFVLIERNPPRGFEKAERISFEVADEDVVLEVKDQRIKESPKPKYVIPFTGV